MTAEAKHPDDATQDSGTRDYVGTDKNPTARVILPKSGSTSPQRVSGGRILRLLLSVLGLTGLLAAGYAWILSSPTGASPDDDYHLTSIWCPRPIEQHCEVTGKTAEGELLVEVPQTVAGSSAVYAYKRDVPASGLTNLSDDTFVPTTRVDTGNYPGYYYQFMHLFVQRDVDRAVLVMRWFNFSLAVTLYGAAALLMTAAGRRLITYTLLATSVPVSLYFTTTTNPTSWAITGIVSLWLGLQGFFTTHGWRRMALAGVALVGAVVASAARMDSTIYCAIVAVAMSVLHLPKLIAEKRLVWLPATTAMTGAITFLTIPNVGTFMSATEPGTTETRSALQVLWSNVVHLPRVLSTFFSCDLGWFDVPTPTLTSVMSLLVTLTIVGFGFARSRADWHKTAALLILAGAIYALPIAMMQQRLQYLDEWGVQVRYVAPLIIVLAGVALSGSDRADPVRMPNRLSIPTLIALAVAHAAMLHTLIERYASGMLTPGLDLNADVQWWRAASPEPMAMWAIGSVGFALACAAGAFAHHLAQHGATS